MLEGLDIEIENKRRKRKRKNIPKTDIKKRLYKRIVKYLTILFIWTMIIKSIVEREVLLWI